MSLKPTEEFTPMSSKKDKRTILLKVGTPDGIICSAKIERTRPEKT